MENVLQLLKIYIFLNYIYQLIVVFAIQWILKVLVHQKLYSNHQCHLNIVWKIKKQFASRQMIIDLALYSHLFLFKIDIVAKLSSYFIILLPFPLKSRYLLHMITNSFMILSFSALHIFLSIYLKNI